MPSRGTWTYSEVDVLHLVLRFTMVLPEFISVMPRMGKVQKIFSLIITNILH